MTVELLAPAKDKETAFAAIDCGADAVYMGAPAFSARKNAPNSLEDIKEVVDYAHKYWAKVRIALNTILTDSELDEAVELAYKLKEIGIDALIIQDMGLLMRLIADTSPQPSPQGEGVWDIPIHMSTQCDNYLPRKVKFFNEIGVSRVILARELSIEQIKEIHNQNPNLELESFIHGALCVSMSGQCYLSQYIGGRSANRGECAQPCRKKYDVIDDVGNIINKNIYPYPLCLKDFNGSKWINDLINAGICSFKIEGRLKDTGYVKNIVAYYRSKIGKGTSSGKSIYPFTPDPEKSFNRGFTDYFLNGRTNCYNLESPKSRGKYLGKVTEVSRDWFKIKTKENIYPQDGLYFNGDGCLVNKVVDGKIYPNKEIKIKIGDRIYRNLDVQFEKELLKPVKRQIGVNVTVSSIPPFPGSEIIQITDEDGIKISSALDGEKAKNTKKMKETFIKQFSKTGEEDFYINNFEINTEIPFMPVSKVNKLRKDLFKKLMEKRIEIYNAKIKQKQGKMKYSKYFVSEVDYRANVHNKTAKEFYEKCGVKVLEPSLETGLPNRQIELMKCKHCIKYALNMCKSPLNLALKDEHGKIYPLKFDCKNCEMKLLSKN